MLSLFLSPSFVERAILTRSLAWGRRGALGGQALQ